MSEWFVNIEIVIKIKSPDIDHVPQLTKELLDGNLLSKDITGYEITAIEKSED